MDRFLAFAKAIPFPPGQHIGAQQERVIAEAVRKLVEGDLLLRQPPKRGGK